MNWKRVNKKEVCSACGKDDWCLLSPDGKTALCMRVYSNRPFLFKTGETGYLHPVCNTAVIAHPPPTENRPAPVINVGSLMKRWLAGTPRKMVIDEACRLGVSSESLSQLGFVWTAEHKAWAIPMRDGNNNYVGIRLRSQDGRKWAVKGSHQGIFIPQAHRTRTMLITEGPTDTAAGLTLGFFTVGRPSCSGGMGDIRALVTRNAISHAVIISDNDDRQEIERGVNPGISGSLMLSNQLPIMHMVVILPGAKDLREFLRNGGTKGLLDCIINSNTWIRPSTLPPILLPNATSIKSNQSLPQAQPTYLR